MKTKTRRKTKTEERRQGREHTAVQGWYTDGFSTICFGPLMPLIAARHSGEGEAPWRAPKGKVADQAQGQAVAPVVCRQHQWLACEPRAFWAGVKHFANIMVVSALMALCIGLICAPGEGAPPGQVNFAVPCLVPTRLSVSLIGFQLCNNGAHHGLLTTTAAAASSKEGR